MQFFGRADLMLNNRGQVVHDVTPTWYVQGRGAVVGDVIHVPAAKAGFYDLAAFLPADVRLSQVDGLNLSYSGKMREVWAQVVLRPLPRAEPTESLDAPFNMRDDYKGSDLETVWPVEGRDQRTVIALANTSDQVLLVQASDPDGQREIRLEPHSGRLVHISTHSKAVRADWLRLQSSGAPGALRASGFVMLPQDTRPRLIRFFDPSASLQSNLYATGLPTAGTSVTIALKNTSTADVIATAQFLDPISGEPTEAMPAISVPGGQAVSVTADLGHIQTSRVGVRVLNSGGAGSLIGTLHSTNAVTDIGYEMPLRDSGGTKASTGSYPWRLDDDYETNVSITNVGTTPARYIARLYYDGGNSYVIKTSDLPIGATMTFDIRQLRDGHVPDALGHTLPADLEHGQFSWSLTSNLPGAHLSGRSEVVSASQRMSSSFSCWVCCENSLEEATVVADAPDIGIDETTYVQAWGYYVDCYNGSDWYPIGDATYSSSNYNVLGIGTDYSSWWAVGVDEGSALVLAHWDDATWEEIPEHGEGDIFVHDSCEEHPFGAEGQVTVQPHPIPKDFKEDESKRQNCVAPSCSPIIYFEYTWKSSGHGTPSTDLSACYIHEVVDEQDWSNSPPHLPLPFDGAPSTNPLVRPIDPGGPATANDGRAADFHDMGWVANSAQWVTKTITATQKYEYRCTWFPGYPNTAAWKLLKNIGTITRKFEPDNNNDWKLTLTKSGYSGVVRHIH